MESQMGVTYGSVRIAKQFANHFFFYFGTGGHSVDAPKEYSGVGFRNISQMANQNTHATLSYKLMLACFCGLICGSYLRHHPSKSWCSGVIFWGYHVASDLYKSERRSYYISTPYSSSYKIITKIKNSSSTAVCRNPICSHYAVVAFTKTIPVISRMRG